MLFLGWVTVYPRRAIIPHSCASNYTHITTDKAVAFLQSFGFTVLQRPERREGLKQMEQLFNELELFRRNPYCFKRKNTYQNCYPINTFLVRIVYLKPNLKFICVCIYKENKVNRTHTHSHKHTMTGLLSIPSGQHPLGISNVCFLHCLNTLGGSHRLSLCNKCEFQYACPNLLTSFYSART